MMNKNPLIAFLLAFIPGAGHAYLGRYVRCILYGGGFFGSIALCLFIFTVSGGADESSLLFLFLAALFGFSNMLDMIITLLSGKAISHAAAPPYAPYGEQGGSGALHQSQPSFSGAGPQGAAYSQPNGAGAAYSQYGGAYRNGSNGEQQQEKTRTILLSIIPGLGHMSLGLMQRGITFLVSFVGLFAIILFLSIITRSGSLLVFLFALPIIWIYAMFDAVSLVQSKHRGEELEDKSLFDGIEAHIASGHKNKVLTIALSIFPGAGHLYLGLQKRGLQLMGGFLLAIYIMDQLRLSLFLFLLPVYWCFALFDALGQLSRYGRQKLNDEPILPMFVPYQRWMGVALIGFGIYFLLDRIIMSVISRYFVEIQIQYMQYKYMLPTAIIAFVMIVVGLRLAFGSRSLLGARTQESESATPMNEEGDARG